MLATLTAIPFHAVAEDAAKQQPAPGAPADEPVAKKAKLGETELRIVAHLHHVNRVEITMGKQAQKVGTAAVKKYGEMVVRDHATADRELVAFTRKRGIAKIPADKPASGLEKAEQAAHSEALRRLKTLEGEAFDRAYLQRMVEGHGNELAWSDLAIALAQDAELETMLASRKATLQRQIDAARELQRGNAQASAAPTKPTK